MQTKDAEVAEKLVADAMPAGLETDTELGILLGDAPSGAGRRLERLTFKSGLAFEITIGRTGDGQLKLARDGLNVDARPRSVRGAVGTDLFWSMRAAGVPAEAASEFVEAASKRVNLRSVADDARYEIVIDHLRLQGGGARSGPVLYGSLQHGGRNLLTLVRWTIGEQAALINPYGVERQVKAFARPVNAGVSSRFGSRVHPILRFGRFHSGVDFGARSGTPVIAAADGYVRAAGWFGGYGRQVQLAHSAGMSTSYSHLSQLAVAPGTRVRQGDVVGYVGSSGFSTGAHLHYEVRKNGYPVDPLTFSSASAPLTPTDLAALRARAEQLRGV